MLINSSEEKNIRVSRVPRIKERRFCWFQNINTRMNEAIAGSCAGITGTALGFPLDTIKTRMQTAHVDIFKAAKRILLEEGVGGFYRGVAAPLISLTILNTLNFSAYNINCRFIGVEPLKAEGLEWRYGIAGMMVGPLSSFVSTPFELVKAKMQVGKASGIHFQNSFQTARHILSVSGFRGLYQGHLVNTVREMVFLSTYFVVYENSKAEILKFMNHSDVAIPMAGGIAGAMGWFVSFPLDNIKSNIQTMQLTNVFNRKSAYRIGMDILGRRGLFGLYSGIVPSIMRAFIVSATRFSTYEYVLRIIGSTP
jgi:solute carrier family 25 carnitine/acylcarnitine transporter 20/29